jgi:hypothetical protein
LLVTVIVTTTTKVRQLRYLIDAKDTL